MFFTGSSPDKVSDTNFRDFYPFINANTDWLLISVSADQIITEQIEPFVSEELLDDLKTKFDADTLSTQETELVKLLNRAIAHYTIWHISPNLNITISNNGLKETSDTQGTTTPAEAWRYKHHHWMVMKKADSMLDKALQYIHENLSSFAIYTTNSYYFKKCIIQNLKDFEKFENLNQSFRTFYHLIPFIRKAEARYLQPLIGREMLAELHTQIDADTLTADNSSLLEKCQAVVSEYALKTALPKLSIILENGHAFMVSSMDGMNTKQVRHDNAIADLKDQLEQDGELAANELQNFIQTNIDDYPTLKASDTYLIYDDSNEVAKMDLRLGTNTGGIFLP